MGEISEISHCWVGILRIFLAIQEMMEVAGKDKLPAQGGNSKPVLSITLGEGRSFPPLCFPEPCTVIKAGLQCWSPV